MGSFEEDVMSYRDNIERTGSVASFYMDETEIANIHWLEYIHYLAKDSSQEAYQAALPDTMVWVGKLAFNDPYVEHYFRYPGFRYFPVVGISWNQASKYAVWRTRAVNIKLAQDAGEDEDAALLAMLDPETAQAIRVMRRLAPEKISVRELLKEYEANKAVEPVEQPKKKSWFLSRR